MLSAAVAIPPDPLRLLLRRPRRRRADPGRLRRAPRRARASSPARRGSWRPPRTSAGLRVAPLRPRAARATRGHRAPPCPRAGPRRPRRGISPGSPRTSARRVVIAWGMRAVLAAAPLRLGVPVLAIHNDLLPPGPAGTAVRAATRRCAGNAGPLARDCRRPAGAPPCSTRASRWTARRAAAAGAAASALARRARPVEAARSRDRHRRADAGGHVRPRRIAARPLTAASSKRGAAPRARPIPHSAGGSACSGQVPDAARSSRARTRCCTPPTPSPSGWCWSRRWPPAAPSSLPPPQGRWRSSARTAAGRLYAPGDADAAAVALRASLADPGAPAAARARAAATSTVEASAARFAATVAALRD